MIADSNNSYVFPSLEEATPEGLVAVGGDLNRGRLLTAYRQGIFPWYSKGQPILWWSPDPRIVLYTGKVKVSRSLRQTLRHGDLTITMDSAFEDVVKACAAPRGNERETWITDDMCFAYCDLHRWGNAHSIEVWHNNNLVGGLYGVALGDVFFGESMFYREKNASKVALVGLDWHLQKMHFRFIDCQIPSKHLFSLGAECINRVQFMAELEGGLRQNRQPGPWELEISATMLA